MADVKSPAAKLPLALRLAVGTTIVGACVYFSLTQGELLATIQPLELVAVTLIAVVIVFCNSLLTLRSIVLLGGKLKHKDALAATALGTFSNSLLGLPVGTAYKFFVLRSKSGLTYSHIGFSLVYFTLLNVAVLVGMASLASGLYWMLFPALVILLLPLTPAGLQPGFARRYFSWREHLINLGLSFVTCCAMIGSYLILTSGICANTVCYMQQVAVIGYGAALNIGINGQSIGGLQELTMGLSSYLNGFGVLHGVELAIVTRVGSFLAALIWIVLLGIRLKLVASPQG